MYRLLEDSDTLTFRQRWAHYLTLTVLIFVVLLGIMFRNRALYAVEPYTNTESGIEALYPQDWLLESGDDYVFRVRDMAQLGFKTTIQIEIQPVSSDTTAQNVLNSLTLNRSLTLSNYSVLSIDDYALAASDAPAVAMFYTFVTQESGVGLESIPSVVSALDILTIQRGQAIIITFQADRSIYDQEFALFERFLNSLDF